MKRLLSLFFAACACAAGPSQDFFDRLADAIWHAEGGRRARVPYGILSVPVKNAAEARAICIRTCRRVHARWQRQQTGREFISYLADQYCPAKHDPVGHKNWVKNVRKYFLRPKTS